MKTKKTVKTLPPKILVVDDDPSLQRVLKNALEEDGYQVIIAEDTVAATALLSKHQVSLVILDLNLPTQTGLAWFEQEQLQLKHIPVIVVTAQNTVENAIKAMQLGAFDYVTKPFDIDELYRLVRQAFNMQQTLVESDKNNATKTPPALGLVGTSAKMQDVYKTIGKMSTTNATILVTGESGTGKELIAKAIHQFSTRASKPFIAVNMTAIPSDLLEAELFGYEKGAFTGATQTYLGKFREANGGTLLLDEIGDMPLELQTKLLRVLQEKEVTSLGARKPVNIDVRIVAATQVPLENAIAAGKFRADLFYRLNVVEIHLPPLRDRCEDIGALVALFLKQMRDRQEIPPKSVTEDALKLLMKMPWPGNIRQLENLVRRVALLSPHRQLTAEHFLQFIESGQVPTNKEEDNDQVSFASLLEQKLKTYVEAMAQCGDNNVWDTVVGQLESVLLVLTLQVCDGNQLRAAKLLGINRNTIRKKLLEHAIDPSQFRKSA